MTKKLIGFGLLAAAAAIYFTTSKKKTVTAAPAPSPSPGMIPAPTPIIPQTGVPYIPPAEAAIITKSGAEYPKPGDPTSILVPNPNGSPSSVIPGESVIYGNTRFILSRIFDKNSVALVALPPATGWITAGANQIRKA